MDGILALGHFCETHGPCIILCTQRSKEEPQQLPHSLTVPWCEACRSLDLDQVLVSRDKSDLYVTARTPIQQDLAFLLKQAVVRSLSCEETNQDGGTLYFGDNERGHVISHTFKLQDSLARGFHRKYSILMLMRDKIHLLNSWPYLTRHIKEISSELQSKAAKVNGVEQTQFSQRAVRQAQNSPSSPARSLSQLIGEPAIFAHLHMWFTWLLSSETIVEKPVDIPKIPISCSPILLKSFFKQIDLNVFRTVCYCILTGIPVIVVGEDDTILNAFRQLLPTNWELPKTGEICKLKKICGTDGKWVVEWPGCLPGKLPKLLTLTEEALKNDDLPDSALEPYLNSLILQWYNISKTLSCLSTTEYSKLFQVLGVQKCDLPLLAYWTTECRNNCK